MAPSLASSRRSPPTHPSEIERWREEIDHLDGVLVRLLNLRARLALKVAGSKHAAGLPLHVPARERDVLRNVADTNAGPLDGAAPCVSSAGGQLRRCSPPCSPKSRRAIGSRSGDGQPVPKRHPTPTPRSSLLPASPAIRCRS